MKTRPKGWMVVGLALACAAGTVMSGCMSVDLGSLLSTELKEVVVADSTRHTRDRILIVDVSGTISETAGGGLLSDEASCTPESVKAVLNRAEGDPRVKAVILRIDSPGGGVAASDTIYHEVRQFRKRTGLPVVAAINGLGCSGAYYIASAADAIYAHPTSLTGSIGVVAYFHGLKELAGKIGYEQIVFKSGPLKDMGNPLRSMPDAERKIVQDVVMAFYGRFLDAVVEGRPGFASADELRPVADGRVYTAEQALKLKLIDRIAYLDEVIEQVKKTAKLDDAKVITYTEHAGPDANIYTSRQRETLPIQTGVRVEIPELVGGLQAGFYYVWAPGVF